MLYKKNSAGTLTDDLFKNPTSEYRGTPFWAWNNLLTKEELCRQIDVFKEMGLGGFHMHVRTGLKNKYLSDEYMELVKTCVEKAKSEGMLAWLYDEDRWPSGAAGGLVTCDEKYRARNLLWTTKKNGEVYASDDKSRSDGGRSGNERLLACYDIVLDSDGYLQSYKRIEENEEPQGTKWYALLSVYGTNSWHNDQSYADTLNSEAIKRFVEVTHERYKESVGEEFGKTVPAIFTDEPQFARKKTFENSFDTKDVSMPWTDRVPELYKETYGADIFDTLPEIFWDLKDGAPSLHRYRYHDFIAELFASSFADTVGSWCEENGIALTGHMMEEPSLSSQTAALGEAMRSYRSFGLPGIDMLCNAHEFTTAKQAQSAAHQYGYEGVLSELYGVTGWDCDFRTYKHQGDWQAALGITVRVPHLSWYAMAGEAKRDYPASISYQSPWYKEYGAIEDHFARLNTALTRGKPVIKVGVIHPVESFWLHWGPNDKSGIFREGCDENFFNLTKWLLEGGIDFNFISESLLPSLCEKGDVPFRVGEMEYDTVIVPACETLRSTTLERLEEFRKKGGRLIFLGAAPELCDAVVSQRGKNLYDISEKADYTRSAVITAMEKDRVVTLRRADGKLTDSLIYQLRQDEDCKWLFVCRDKEPYNKDIDCGENVKITVNGEYGVLVYDTGSGDIYPAEYSVQKGKTVISERMYGYDSRLYKLADVNSVQPASAKTTSNRSEVAVNTLTDYELSEENILVLDMAEYKIQGEKEFSPREEILRLDNICRKKLGLRERGGAVVQPWVYGEEPDVSKVTLRYTFQSEIEYNGALLALEDAQKAEILFNGEKVSSHTVGNYVDVSIFKVKLPQIKKGENVLEITYPFGPSANLETVFIIGYFGVKLVGSKATLVPLPEKIGFGDILSQGFPFYSGAITYKIPVQVENNGIEVEVSDYRGALVGVSVDGEKKGRIIYPPYRLEINGLSEGMHEIGIKLYIHRYNSFGALHLVNEKESWHGPGAWRSTGQNWSYEYVLRKNGILKAPIIRV